MHSTQSKSGVLIALAAAAGAFGAAAMMAVAASPSARADDSTLILDAINGDYAAGQADYAKSLVDFGNGAYGAAVAESFDGANEYSLAAPDNLLLGSVEALAGDPITGTLPFDVLSGPVSFTDAVTEAQILFNDGESLLSLSATELAAGAFGLGTEYGLVGSVDAYVFPVEELIIGAVSALTTVPE